MFKDKSGAWLKIFWFGNWLYVDPFDGSKTWADSQPKQKHPQQVLSL
jgi:hypothetical protein